MLLITKFDPQSLCPFCEVIQVPYSKHCFACNKCVEEFDHHCYWVNNCVGKKNQYAYLSFVFSFITYLASILLSSLIRIYLSFICLTLAYRSESTEFKTAKFHWQFGLSNSNLQTDLLLPHHYFFLSALPSLVNISYHLIFGYIYILDLFCLTKYNIYSGRTQKWILCSK